MSNKDTVEKTKKTPKKRILLAGIFLVFAFLSFIGVFSTFQEKVILPPAENYIERSQEKALHGFILISAVKAAVAIVEGSEIVGVEVGDAVQPLYDAIDITWKLIAASLATLYAFGFILKLCSLLGSYFLGAALVLLALVQYFKNETLRRYTYFFGVLAFSFYIAVPMSLFLSGKVTDELFGEDRERFETEMQNIKESYQQSKEELNSASLIDFETTSIPMFGGHDINLPRLDTISFGKLNVIIGFMDELPRMDDVSELFISNGVAWVLDVIVIPIGMLLLLYKIVLLFVNSFFGAGRSDKIERAVSAALAKQLQRDQ